MTTMHQNNRFRNYAAVLLMAIFSALITACGGGGGGGGGSSGGGGGGTPDITRDTPCNGDGCLGNDPLPPIPDMAILDDPTTTLPSQEAGERSNLGARDRTIYETESPDGTFRVSYSKGARSFIGPDQDGASTTFTLKARDEAEKVLPDDIENAGVAAAYYNAPGTPAQSLARQSARQDGDDDVVVITGGGCYILENEYSAAGLLANDALLSDSTTDPYFDEVMYWGVRTPASRIRTAGQATYTGPVIGYCDDCGDGGSDGVDDAGDYLALGEIALTADFANVGMEGTMSLSAYDAADGLRALQSAGSASTVSPGESKGKVALKLTDGAITGNEFSGDTKYDSGDNQAAELGVFTALADAETDDADGEFKGKFHGYDGSEVSGFVDLENGAASLEVAYTSDRGADASNPLGQPQNVTRTVTGFGSAATVTLTWSPVAGAGQYVVFHGTRGMIHSITHDASTTYTYTDTPGDGAHTYQIFARNGDLESPRSSVRVAVAPDPLADMGDTVVQVGSGTRTIDELTSDTTFIQPQAIVADSVTQTLASAWRYYSWGGEDLYSGFIYRAGANGFWYRESEDGGSGGSGVTAYEDFNEEYRLVGRDANAFSVNNNQFAFAGYDYWQEGEDVDAADFFLLEGDYAAVVDWWSSPEFNGRIGLMTPRARVPSTGYAVYSGKAVGGYVFGDPVNGANPYSRVANDENGVRGSAGQRYLVLGDVGFIVEFDDDDVDVFAEFRAYEKDTSGRAYLDHLIGDGAAAPTDADVVGTLQLTADADIRRSYNPAHAPVFGDAFNEFRLDDDEDNDNFYVINYADTALGVFDPLVNEGHDDSGFTRFRGNFYGPNVEEIAGEIRFSTCLDYDSTDSECDGDLHYFSAGFVAKNRDDLPRATPANTPAQGDTLAEALAKLRLSSTPTFDSEVFGDVTYTEYGVPADFADYPVTVIDVYKHEYASFGLWAKLATDARGELFVDGDTHLHFTDNQVTSLPTSGTANYNLYSQLYETSSTGGRLTADFGAASLTGNIAISYTEDGITDAIQMDFVDGAIQSAGTFSGGLMVSGVSGEFGQINTGRNGRFSGAFYDNPATYDASAAPAELAGSIDQVMDSNGEEWTGAFLGKK